MPWLAGLDSNQRIAGGDPMLYQLSYPPLLTRDPESNRYPLPGQGLRSLVATPMATTLHACAALRTGFEPVTSRSTGGRSTTELTEQGPQDSTGRRRVRAGVSLGTIGAGPQTTWCQTLMCGTTRPPPITSESVT